MVKFAKNSGKRLMESRIIRSSAALLVSDSSSTAIGLVTSVVLAQKFGTELSLIYIAIALVDTIKNFLDIRPEEGVIRFVGNAMALEQRSRAITFFYVGLMIDLVLMVATLAVVAISVGPAASIYNTEAETLRRLMGIYLLTIPLNGIQGTFAAVVQTFKRFNWLAIVTLTQRIAFLLYVIVQPDMSGVMWGYVLQEAIGFALISGMGWWLLRKHVQTFRAEHVWQSTREFVPFAFHTSVTASLKVLTTNIDVLILGAVRPYEVAFFKLARSAANLVVLPTQPLRTAIYPELNEAWAKGDLGRVRHLINKYMAASLAMGAGLFAVLAISADWLVWLIYPPEFAPVADVLRILGIGLVLQSLFSWIRPAAMADNQPQLVTFYSMITSLLYVPLMLIAIYYGGVIGAAVAFDVWMVASTVLFIFYVIPRLRLKLFEVAPKGL